MFDLKPHAVDPLEPTAPPQPHLSRSGVTRRTVSFLDLDSYRKKMFRRRSKTYELPPEGSSASTSSGRRLSLLSRFGSSLRNLRGAFSSGTLVQRFLPTQFSNERTDGAAAPEEEEQPNLRSGGPTVVRLHVYRINDHLGFYHTGLVFAGDEYTFCQTRGICRHDPRAVAFATFLGSVRLGQTNVAPGEAFRAVLRDMRDKGGFRPGDYDIMENSCNSFTEELARRLGVMERYPAGVLNQSKLADLLSPVARALLLVPDSGAEGSASAPSGRSARSLRGSLMAASKSEIQIPVGKRKSL